jgi:hypothetical protein
MVYLELKVLGQKISAQPKFHKIRGRRTVMRTSLYADDAAIFVAPIKEDIQNLVE